MSFSDIHLFTFVFANLDSGTRLGTPRTKSAIDFPIALTLANSDSMTPKTPEKTYHKPYYLHMMTKLQL